MGLRGCGAVLLAAALCTLAASPAGAGGVFVTGHDLDYHAANGPNQTGARRILQRAIGYLTGELANPRVLLVTDLRNPGGDQGDPRAGLAAAGFTFDAADHGSGTPGVLDLNSVDFRSYDAVVVASDYGGWLRQDELDILNARRAELAEYVSQPVGGALVVLNESGNREGAGVYPGTSHDRYAFLPVTLTAAALGHGENSLRVLAGGTAMGLVDRDVLMNPVHSVFTQTGGLDIVDVDSHGRIVSLVQSTADRTPPAIVFRLATRVLWPPQHDLVDVRASVSVSDDYDASPQVRIGVFCNEDDEASTGDGRHSPDAKWPSGGSLRLRAERNRSGYGRVYLIIVTATDASGNVSRACHTVLVPISLNHRWMNAVRSQARAADRHGMARGTAPRRYFICGDGAIIGRKQ